MTKDQIAGHLEEFKYILGTEVLLRELVRYFSTEELQEFIKHIEAHYDIKYYEEELVRSYMGVVE